MRKILPVAALFLTLTAHAQDGSTHGQDTTTIKKDTTPWAIYHAIQATLDSVFITDQAVRKDIQTIQTKYGPNSHQMDSVMKLMRGVDTINTKKVVNILDNHGWLSIDDIGEKANLAIFLVIQHSNSKTQQKYLPLMREAVKQGKAKPDQLALLEDRVLTNQGKPQLYGSQVRSIAGGKYAFYPIADEKNVNQRRAEMGLEPLEQYARYYNIDYHLPK